MSPTTMVSSDPELNAKLAKLSTDACKCWRDGANNFITVCRIFGEAHELLGDKPGRKQLRNACAIPPEGADPNGQDKISFRRWVTQYTPFSIRTAQQHVLAHRILQHPCLQNLPKEQLRLIDQTAVYELAKAPDTAVRLAAEKAGNNERVTVRDVKGERKRLSRRSPLNEQPEPEPEGEIIDADSVTSEAEPAAEAHATIDGRGFELPAEMVEVFDDAQELAGIVKRWRADRTLALRIAEHRRAGQAIEWMQLKTDISNAIEGIVVATPYAVCPDCKGKGCDHSNPKRVNCGGRGWLTKDQWKGVPETQRG